ncbi:hypothetical protein Btru_027424 [Bulinus truncatus]|nr:hypothetical protein Btru_027424 [Bulinus truncatus]
MNSCSKPVKLVTDVDETLPLVKDSLTQGSQEKILTIDTLTRLLDKVVSEMLQSNETEDMSTVVNNIVKIETSVKDIRYPELDDTDLIGGWIKESKNEIFMSQAAFRHINTNNLRQFRLNYGSQQLKKDKLAEKIATANLKTQNVQWDINRSLYLSSVNLTSDEKNLRATDISNTEYETWVEETLDSLSEFFEELPEIEACNEDYDCAYGSGVLTVHLGSTEGTYVLNKQTPNKQIWLSSPLSGPKRFDYYQGQWVYLKDGTGLHKLLEEEMLELTGIKVDLKKCKFYTCGVAERMSKIN